jgi:hypothetical protein
VQQEFSRHRLRWSIARLVLTHAAGSCRAAMQRIEPIILNFASRRARDWFKLEQR